MAADPLDKLRLTLMQELLPVGVAVVERVRKGGFKDVVAAFSRDGEGRDPLTQLRNEGEPLASQLRQGLDRLRPGLGNPVMKVDVRVEPEPPAPGPGDEAALVARLGALEQRLTQLETLLDQAP